MYLYGLETDRFYHREDPVHVVSLYPVLMTDDVSASAAFFVDLLDFSVVFETPWYVSLASGRQELALVDRDHPTIPVGHCGASSQHLLVNVEVDDVDAAHERLVGSGACEELLSLRCEDFGQRHFIVRGPAGVLVDVITPIPPAGDFDGMTVTLDQAATGT